MSDSVLQLILTIVGISNGNDMKIQMNGMFFCLSLAEEQCLPLKWNRGCRKYEM